MNFRLAILRPPQRYLLGFMWLIIVLIPIAEYQWSAGHSKSSSAGISLSGEDAGSNLPATVNEDYNWEVDHESEDPVLFKVPMKVSNSELLRVRLGAVLTMAFSWIIIALNKRGAAVRSC